MRFRCDIGYLWIDYIHLATPRMNSTVNNPPRGPKVLDHFFLFIAFFFGHFGFPDLIERYSDGVRGDPPGTFIGTIFQSVDGPSASPRSTFTEWTPSFGAGTTPGGARAEMVRMFRVVFWSAINSQHQGKTIGKWRFTLW